MAVGGRKKGDGRGRLGGRAKGTPNKVTKELRERAKEFTDGHFDEFVSAWKMIEDPKEKCDIYLKITKFVLPTLSSVEMNANVEYEELSDEIAELAKEDE